MTSQEYKHKQSVHTDINAQIIRGTNQVCMYIGTWNDVFDEYEQLKKENEELGKDKASNDADYITISVENDKLTKALNVAEDALKYMTEEYDCDPADVADFNKRRAEEALAEIKKIKGGT